MKFPMSAEDALKVLNPYLWEHEKSEIYEYDTVYYFSINERKKNKS